MGTSTSYPGPTGTNPLLPPWAPDPEDFGPPPDEGGEEPPAEAPPADLPPDALPVTWRQPKVLMGRVARSGTIGRAGQDRIRRSVKSYVQNRGGARNAARGSVAGRQTVIRLGSFLSDIARRGVAEAVRGQGLGRFLGQPIDLLIEALARMLLPDGADVDEALARDAGLEALSDLLEDVGAREGSIEQLDRLDRGLAERTIERFVENYIAEHFLHALASKIEADAIQAEHAVAVERQVREYIANTVRLDFSNVDIFATDWTRDDAQRMIDRILEDAYAILEDA